MQLGHLFANYQLDSYLPGSREIGALSFLIITFQRDGSHVHPEKHS